MDGIILIDKPAGPTSAEVVRRVKARLKARLKTAPRVGHLGTLDPFATGLLPIMVREGTKLAPFIQEGDKEYEGIIALGAETDTLDKTGAVVRTAAVPPLEAAQVRELAARFTGIMEQTPPIFSAIKRGGVPLYRLARRGEDVAPPLPRMVEIRRLELASADADSIRFLLVCSTGTYVRALARDIGVALGSAAHLAALRRLRSGIFTVAEARPLDQVLSALETGASVTFIGLREAMPDLPEVEIDAEEERRLRNGDSRALDCMVPPGARRFKVVTRGNLAAVAETTSRVTAAIARIFTPG
ncbi:MAG: tRNA pseudouridine(55) synthase TruB [Candidatus Binataceae bacterium]